MNEPIISVRNLRVSFEMATGEIEVLKGVDFDIEKAVLSRWSENRDQVNQ